MLREQPQPSSCCELNIEMKTDKPKDAPWRWHHKALTILAAYCIITIPLQKFVSQSKVLKRDEDMSETAIFLFSLGTATLYFVTPLVTMTRLILLKQTQIDVWRAGQTEESAALLATIHTSEQDDNSTQEVNLSLKTLLLFWAGAFIIRFLSLEWNNSKSIVENDFKITQAWANITLALLGELMTTAYRSFKLAHTAEEFRLAVWLNKLSTDKDKNIKRTVSVFVFFFMLLPIIAAVSKEATVVSDGANVLCQRFSDGCPSSLDFVNSAEYKYTIGGLVALYSMSSQVGNVFHCFKQIALWCSRRQQPKQYFNFPKKIPTLLLCSVFVMLHLLSYYNARRIGIQEYSRQDESTWLDAVSVTAGALSILVTLVNRGQQTFGLGRLTENTVTNHFQDSYRMVSYSLAALLAAGIMTGVTKMTSSLIGGLALGFVIATPVTIAAENILYSQCLQRPR